MPNLVTLVLIECLESEIDGTKIYRRIDKAEDNIIFESDVEYLNEPPVLLIAPSYRPINSTINFDNKDSEEKANGMVLGQKVQMDNDTYYAASFVHVRNLEKKAEEKSQ